MASSRQAFGRSRSCAKPEHFALLATALVTLGVFALFAGFRKVGSEGLEVKLVLEVELLGPRRQLELAERVAQLELGLGAQMELVEVARWP